MPPRTPPPRRPGRPRAQQGPGPGAAARPGRARAPIEECACHLMATSASTNSRQASGLPMRRAEAAALWGLGHKGDRLGQRRAARQATSEEGGPGGTPQCLGARDRGREGAAGLHGGRAGPAGPGSKSLFGLAQDAELPGQRQGEGIPVAAGARRKGLTPHASSRSARARRSGEGHPVGENGARSSGEEGPRLIQVASRQGGAKGPRGRAPMGCQGLSDTGRAPVRDRRRREGERAQAAKVGRGSRQPKPDGQGGMGGDAQVPAELDRLNERGGRRVGKDVIDTATRPASIRGCVGPKWAPKPRHPDKASAAEAAAGSGSWLKSPAKKTGTCPNPEAAARAASDTAVQSAASADAPPAGAYALGTCSGAAPLR